MDIVLVVSACLFFLFLAVSYVVLLFFQTQEKEKSTSRKKIIVKVLLKVLLNIFLTMIDIIWIAINLFALWNLGRVLEHYWNITALELS